MDIIKCSETIDNLHELAVKCENKLLNEENTKAALILPFLNMLGYQLILNIEPEYTICSGRVDYYIENKKFNRKSILIECKRLNTNIDDEQYITQIERYTRELEPTISIITNGKLYRFYRLINRQLDLVFTFNINSYSLRDLRQLLNYSKENIKYIEEREKFFDSHLDDMCKQYQELFEKDLRQEIHLRILEDLKVQINTSKLYGGIEILSKIQKLLGEKSSSISIDLPKIKPKQLEISIYDILTNMNIHDSLVFKSNLFGFNIKYNGALATLYKGSKISSKCTYKGNIELENKLENKIENFKLTEDVSNILLLDAINVVFGVRNGRIPEEIDNIIRKDIYNNLEDKYIFQSINSIVTIEINMIAFLETIKQLQEEELGKVGN